MNNIIKKDLNFILILWVVFIVEIIVLFLVFFYALAPKELIQSTQTSDIGILYLAYIFSIIAIPISSKIYSIYQNKAKETENLKEKFNLYRTAFIFKAAIFETSAILLLVAFYFNEIYSPLYLLAVVLIAFLFNKPSLHNFTKDFNSTLDDNAILPMEEDEIIN